MKTFKQYIEESWRRLDAPEQKGEKTKEFNRRGGEVVSQLKGEKETPFMGRTVRLAMQNIRNKQPNLQQTGIFTKSQLKSVKNSTGGQDWEQAKQELNPEKVARAEKSRRGAQTMPTILSVKNPLSQKRELYNVGGNTRLSSMSQHRTAQAHIIPGDINAQARKKID